MVRWRADKDQSQEALAISGFIEVQFEVTVTKFTICIIKIFIPYFVDALFCGCLGLVVDKPQVKAS